MRKYFKETVETKSLIVVTWYRAAPKNSDEFPPKVRHGFPALDGYVRTRIFLCTIPSNWELQHNTFQIAIGSSEGKSFVAMYYPENGIQWAEVATDPERPKFWAQAGLFDGHGELSDA